MAEINKQIGRKIKLIRKIRGISQIELAEKIGLSFQQVQKYEKGSTAISVLRLTHIAEALDTNPSVFVEDDPAFKVSGPKVSYSPKETSLDLINLLNKEEITLVKLFRQVSNKKIRQGLLNQLKGIVELEKKNVTG